MPVKDKKARNAEIKAGHIEQMSKYGRGYVCARCGATDKTLEVFPRVGTGLTLAVAMRQLQHRPIKKILTNRVLLCPGCLRYELTGAHLEDQAVENPTPYVLREVQ